ncbi:MAG: hypothetical protein A2Z91_06670 [Deltaproteobacteria bacterium GWA2_38_16]|nr:MAG: hypothetical protein A2Z91_06670 [Deltaproteobacteria bacterium GWA2_38_16]OGQ03407.1 MAG: hypothetical protein A3D19_04740 [Deltaproteobacteria bacterium RIFCSPHIGHO2_02_FULL_38_15]OGQ34710.1 MAG: hypothetical protein A3A72_07390 [Deltaproteobacteria bacterium RIFCSPLOWO2_01_FULL_38_9]
MRQLGGAKRYRRIITMKKIMVSLFLFISTIGFSASTLVTKTFISKEINTLVYKNGSGDAKIIGTDNENLQILAMKNQFHEKCRLTIEKKNHALFIAVDGEGLLNKGGCNVDFDIQVPKKVSLNLKSGSGNIEINKVQAKLDAKLGSGDLNATLDSCNGLNAKLGSGNLAIQGLNSDANVKTGSGNIELKWARLPEKGAVDIKTGSGTVSLKMPKDSKISTSFKSGSGQLHNYIGDSPDASFKISVFTGSGNLELNKF